VFDLKRGFKNLIALNLPSSRVHEIVTAKLKTFFAIGTAVPLKGQQFTLVLFTKQTFAFDGK